MPIKHEPRQHSRQYNYDDMVDVTESEHDGDDGDECSDDGHLIGNELRMDDILMRPEVFRFYRSLDASAVPRDSPVNYNMPNDINNPQVPFDQLIYTMLDRMDTMISRMESSQQNIRMVATQIEAQQERFQQAVDRVESMQTALMNAMDAIKTNLNC